MEMIDFQWERCRDGYRLDRVDEPFVLTPQGRRPMRQIDGSLDLKGERFYLTAASERFDPYHPLEVPGLFSIFAEDTPSSAKGMQGFCNRFGLPYRGRPDLAPLGVPRSASVDGLLQNQRRLRKALSLFQRGDTSALTTYWNSGDGAALIRTELRVGPEGRLEMAFAPPDLIQAMWLQFAQFACSGAHLFRCQRCNAPFIVGSGTGRRSTSKFCSNACKVATFKERRAQREGGK